MTISDKEYPVSGQVWQDLKSNSLVLPSDSWAQLKIYILEMCQQSGDCAAIQKKIDLLRYANVAH